MACFKCVHKDHVGLCGETMIVQGIETECTCLIPTKASLDRHEVRVRDVIQQADVREAQQAEWDNLPPKKQREVRRRAGLKYRKM